jgi:alpha-tubulin suppressor-like RCC1 family protein
MVRRDVSAAVFVCVFVFAGAVALRCNTVLGVDGYRACVASECDGGTNAADAADAADAPSGVTCQTSADCASAGTSVICSQSKCTSVARLARGMSNFECAVLHDGTARCWGADQAGQLGYDHVSPTSVATPQIVLDANGQPMTGIQDITLGYDFACALRSVSGSTSVWCWGTSQGGGGQTKPQPVSLSNAEVLEVSAANDSACALVSGAAANEVFCWGTNTNGKMGCDNGLACEGDGGAPSPLTATLQVPRKLPSVNPPAYLANGLYALCVGFSSSGFIDCFGTDGFGNLGDGTAIIDSCCIQSSPQPVLPSTVVALRGSDFYTCAQDNDKQWFCWGGNLGEGCPLLNGCSDLHKPTALTIGAGGPILDLSPGWRHACAITANGSGVWCWGQDDHGQVGNGAVTNVNVGPSEASLPVVARPVQDLAAHRHWTCALGADGQVYCWGQNGDQNDSTPWLLGAGSKSGDVPTPARVAWE